MATASNTISLATKYARVLDEVVEASSKTGLLASPDDLKAEFVGAGTVKVPKISLAPLGNYSKTGGYPTGAVTYEFETFTLAYDRGRQFDIDNMDNEQTGGNVVPAVLSQFARTQVVPEVDAIRIARFATGAGHVKELLSAPSHSTIKAEWNAMLEAIDEAGGDPAAGLVFVTPATMTALKDAFSRQFASENDLDTRISMLDGVRIVTVPSARMKSAITVSDNGWTAHEDAVDVYMLYVDPSAVRMIAKHENMRTFAPEVNQDADATRVQYRLYHDAVVYENKADLIYCLRADDGIS
jgi:hypothetical protein